MRLKLLSIALLCLMFGQCDNKKTQDQSFAKEDFESFISHFDRDSIFRNSRVRYSFDKPVDLTLSHIDTSQFKITKIVNDSAIVKTTYLKDSTYWIKFIFKTEDGNWYLMNYLDSYSD